MPTGKRKKTPREFTPITEDGKILELLHEFTGLKKHDDEVGERYGLSKFQTSVLRQVFGKTEFNTKWHTDDMKDAVVNAYQDGEPTSVIAERHAISVSAVYAILESRGVDRNRRDFWSPIKVMKLVKLREVDKLSWNEIGKIMGRTLKCCQAKYSHLKNTGRA